MDYLPCLQEVLVPLSSFSTDKDLARLLLVSRSFSTQFQSVLDGLSSPDGHETPLGQGIGARIFAARKLSFWWRRCRLVRWLCSTAEASNRKHPRPYLTQTNLACLRRGFKACRNSGVCYLSCRSWKTTDFLCPECRILEIGAAVFYFQCCELMSRTVPFFYVGCKSCTDQKTAGLVFDNVCYVAAIDGNFPLQSVLDTLD
jgi:hypothetical protein